MKQDIKKFQLFHIYSSKGLKYVFVGLRYCENKIHYVFLNIDYRGYLFGINLFSDKETSGFKLNGGSNFIVFSSDVGEDFVKNQVEHLINFIENPRTIICKNYF